MATVIRQKTRQADGTLQPNGRRMIQFKDASGKRRTIRLGKITQRDAEAVKVRIEHLVSAQIAGHAPDDETSRWLANVDETLREKLAREGLVASQQKATLKAFIDEYVTGRTDLKPRTRIKFNATRKRLIDHFGANRDLRTITEGDADDWRVSMVSDGLADNTVRKHIQIAKQFFTAAVRKRIIPVNPFAGLKSTVRPNVERFYFVTRDEIDRVIAKCPDAQWRLILALSRFAGLRCPSEHLGLKWGDVDWENGRLTVTSPKTEHHAGGGSRVVPIFPELRPYLEAVWDEAPEGAEHVITRYRDTNSNLRTQLLRIIKRAGLNPWPKLFHNMRSTRETELADQFPMHVVCSWLGNSRPVAMRHYLQVTDDHFSRAVGSAGKNDGKSDGTHGDIGGNELQTGEHRNEKTPENQGFSRPSSTLRDDENSGGGTRRTAEFPRKVAVFHGGAA